MYLYVDTDSKDSTKKSGPYIATLYYFVLIFVTSSTVPSTLHAVFSLFFIHVSGKMRCIGFTVPYESTKKSEPYISTLLFCSYFLSLSVQYYLRSMWCSPCSLSPSLVRWDVYVDTDPNDLHLSAQLFDKMSKIKFKTFNRFRGRKYKNIHTKYFRYKTLQIR